MGPSKQRPVFRKSRLEMPDVDGPKWWDKYLTEIEDEVCKPSTARPDMVFSVIRERETFKMVSAIFGLDEAECDQLCIKDIERERLAKLERERLALEARLREEIRAFRSKSKGSMEPSIASGGLNFNFNDDDEDSEESKESSSSTRTNPEVEEEEEYDAESLSEEDSRTSVELQGHSHFELEDKYDAYSNPYLRFLRRPPERAAIWRPRPPPTPTGAYQADPNMTLIEKSTAVTSKIATDFCSWMRDLGGAEEQEIDEKTLIELFEFEFDKPAARGLVNRIREASTLTPAMAKETCVPELDYRLYVREEIHKDIVAESATPRLIGFGSQIDSLGRVDPPRNNTKAQWTGCRPPPELASFATAFSGVEHMESYTGYCKHLAQNPHLRRPQCMKTWGTFAPQNFSNCLQSRTSLDLDLRVAAFLVADAADVSSTSLLPGKPSDSVDA